MGKLLEGQRGRQENVALFGKKKTENVGCCRKITNMSTVIKANYLKKKLKMHI